VRALSFCVCQRYTEFFTYYSLNRISEFFYLSSLFQSSFQVDESEVLFADFIAKVIISYRSFTRLSTFILLLTEKFLKKFKRLYENISINIDPIDRLVILKFSTILCYSGQSCFFNNSAKKMAIASSCTCSRTSLHNLYL